MKILLTLLFCFYSGSHFLSTTNPEWCSIISTRDGLYIIEFLEIMKMNKGDKNYLIDPDKNHDFQEYIAVEIIKAVKNCYILREIEVNQKRILNKEYEPIYLNRILNLIQSGTFEYILYAPNGRGLRWFLPLNKELEEVEGIRYKRIFSGPIYWLYKKDHNQAQ